jgi:hypothetical protein
LNKRAVLDGPWRAVAAKEQVRAHASDRRSRAVRRERDLVSPCARCESLAGAIGLQAEADVPELHGPLGTAAFVGESEPAVRAGVWAREEAVVAVAGGGVVVVVRGSVGVKGREFVLGAGWGLTADEGKALEEGRRRR